MHKPLFSEIILLHLVIAVYVLSRLGLIKFFELPGISILWQAFINHYMLII